MNKTKRNIQWWLALVGGCVLGFVASFATMEIIDNTLSSNRASEYRDIIDKNLKFDEQVIVDNDSYKITVLGMNVLEGNSFDNHLDLKIENLSDTTYSFMPGVIKINGYMIETSMVEKLAVNETKEVSLTITTMLKDVGIEKISDMELEFFILDEGKNEYFRDGSYLIKSNYYGTYDQEEVYKDNNITEVYNDGKIKLSFISDLEKNLDMYPVVIENLTDNKISFYDSKIEVNGAIVNDGLYMWDLPGHTKSISVLNLSFNDIEKDKIGKKLESLRIALNIGLYDAVTLEQTEKYDTGMIKIK